MTDSPPGDASVRIATREPSLPDEFADLADLLGWALPTEEERYAKRLASSIEELREFYARVLPRVPEAQAHLDRLDPKALPSDAQHLLWILFSLIVVSYAVDVFDEPKVPDTGSAYVRRVQEPSSAPV